MVHSLAASLGLFSQMKMIKHIRASYKDLQVYHSRDYLDFVLSPQGEITMNAQLGLEDDCPPFRGLSDYVQLVAGASLTAASARRDSGHLLGRGKVGLIFFTYGVLNACFDRRHHAQKSRASGFCYVADCILDILAFKRFMIPTDTGQRRKPRIMYLDLDLHFSDAVSQAFYSPKSTHPSQVLVRGLTLF